MGWYQVHLYTAEGGDTSDEDQRHLFRKDQQVCIYFWLPERGLVGVKRTLHTDDILYLAQTTQDALNLIQHTFSGHDF